MGGIKGDFTGFTYGGIHSSELGLTRVSDGNRYNENLAPTSTLKTTPAPGGNFTFFFNKLFTQKQFSINVAFDSMTELQHRRFQKLMSTKVALPLIFDEFPYKEYSAVITGTPTMKSICFDTREGDRVYKGEGTIQFTCYVPWAHTRHDDNGKILKYLEQYNNPNIASWDSWYDVQWYNNNDWQWDESSGMLAKQGNYDKVTGSIYLTQYNNYRREDNLISEGVIPHGVPMWQSTEIQGALEIPVYNPGDFPADYSLTVEKPIGFDLIIELAHYPNKTVNKLFQYKNPYEQIKEVWGIMSYDIQGEEVLNELYPNSPIDHTSYKELTDEELADFRYLTDLIILLGGDPVLWWNWWGKVVAVVKSPEMQVENAYRQKIISSIIKRLRELTYDAGIIKYSGDDVLNDYDNIYQGRAYNSPTFIAENMEAAVRNAIRKLVEIDGLTDVFSITDDLPEAMKTHLESTYPPPIARTLLTSYEEKTGEQRWSERYKIKDMSDLTNIRRSQLKAALGLTNEVEAAQSVEERIDECESLIRECYEHGTEEYVSQILESWDGNQKILTEITREPFIELYEKLKAYFNCGYEIDSDESKAALKSAFNNNKEIVDAYLNDATCVIHSDLGLLLNGADEEPRNTNVLNKYLEGRIFKIPENLQNFETRIRIYAVSSGTFTPVPRSAVKRYYNTANSKNYQIKYDYLYL